jgi:hypothetical protein
MKKRIIVQACIGTVLTAMTIPVMAAAAVDCWMQSQSDCDGHPSCYTVRNQVGLCNTHTRDGNVNWCWCAAIQS